MSHIVLHGWQDIEERDDGTTLDLELTDSQGQTASLIFRNPAGVAIDLSLTAGIEVDTPAAVGSPTFTPTGGAPQ